MTKKPSIPGHASKMPSGVHAMRRGGARHEVTERVALKSDDGALHEGWALNVSRGGLRVILEQKVVLGQKFDATIGAEKSEPRPTRVVWVQEEPDGVIVGLEFTSLSATMRAASPSSPSLRSEATGIVDVDGVGENTDPGGGVSED